MGRLRSDCPTPSKVRNRRICVAAEPTEEGRLIPGRAVAQPRERGRRKLPLSCHCGSPGVDANSLHYLVGASEQRPSSGRGNMRSEERYSERGTECWKKRTSAQK